MEVSLFILEGWGLWTGGRGSCEGHLDYLNLLPKPWAREVSGQWSRRSSICLNITSQLAASKHVFLVLYVTSVFVCTTWIKSDFSVCSVRPVWLGSARLGWCCQMKIILLGQRQKLSFITQIKPERGNLSGACEVKMNLDCTYSLQPSDLLKTKNSFERNKKIPILSRLAGRLPLHLPP